MRIHGRNGLIYRSVTSGAAASPLTQQASWSVTFARGVQDTTTYGSPVVTYTALLPDISGTFAGFWDDATAQAYLAATDGLPRSMYLYPDSTNPGQFFSGSVLPDYSIDGAIAGGVNVSSTWVQALGTPWTRTFGTGGSSSPNAAVASATGAAAVNA